MVSIYFTYFYYYGAHLLLNRYILVQSITATILSIPIFFIIKNQPESPPSKSARRARRKGHSNLMASLKKLFTKLNFWLITFAYSLIVSLYVVLGASVGTISDSYGYSTDANSIFGLVFIISGLVGSFIQAILLDKFRKYKYQLIVIGLTTILSVGGVALVMDQQKVWLTALMLALMGLSVVPAIGVAFTFCAEI